MSSIKVNPAAVSLAYDIYDQNCSSEGCPLIIIHGLYATKRHWASFSKKCHEVTCRKVITVDVRNHGDSEHSSEMTFKSMSCDIQKFLIQQNIPKVTLIGHSLGGVIAMETALSSPGYIEKCIMVDCSGASLSDEKREMVRAITQTVGKVISSRVKSLGEADAILAETATDDDFRSYLLKNSRFDDDNCVTWSLNLKWITDNLEKLFNGICLDGREKCQGEMLFVAGELSPYLCEEKMPSIKEMFPRAQLEVVAGTGHFLYDEKPKEFFNIVRKFIEGK